MSIDILSFKSKVAGLSAEIQKNMGTADTAAQIGAGIISRADFLHVAGAVTGALGLESKKGARGLKEFFTPSTFEAFVSNYTDQSNLLLIKDFTHNNVFLSMGSIESGTTKSGNPATIFREVSAIEGPDSAMIKDYRKVDPKSLTENLGYKMDKVVTVYADMITPPNSTQEVIKLAQDKLVEEYAKFGLTGIDTGNGLIAFAADARMLEIRDVVSDQPKEMVLTLRIAGHDKIINSWKLNALSPINDPEIGYATAFDTRDVPQAITFVAPTPEPREKNVKKPTEAPEIIKSFPVVTIEKFRDCVITEQELFDGTYLKWLKTLSKPFDASKVKDVPFDVMTIPDSNPMIVFDMDTAPNFGDPETAPFRRDVTFGIVLRDIDGVNKAPYVVKPIEFFDRTNPTVDANRWVITVESYYGLNDPLTGEYLEIPDVDMWIDQNNIIWKKDMRITPIRMTSLTSMTNTTDPLTMRTFNAVQDLQGRFQRFLAGEVGALSEPGIVLNTQTSKMSDGLLK